MPVRRWLSERAPDEEAMTAMPLSQLKAYVARQDRSAGEYPLDPEDAAALKAARGILKSRQSGAEGNEKVPSRELDGLRDSMKDLEDRVKKMRFALYQLEHCETLKDQKEAFASYKKLMYAQGFSDSLGTEVARLDMKHTFK